MPSIAAGGPRRPHPPSSVGGGGRETGELGALVQADHRSHHGCCKVCAGSVIASTYGAGAPRILQETDKISFWVYHGHVQTKDRILNGAVSPIASLVPTVGGVFTGGQWTPFSRLRLTMGSRV